MTVYITQQPVPNKNNWVPDISSAAQYGPLKYVFAGDERINTNPTRAIKSARERLADFDVDQDFVCWPNSGDPASLYVVIMVLIADGNDEITFLGWNRRRDENNQTIPNKGFYSPILFRL